MLLISPWCASISPELKEKHRIIHCFACRTTPQPSEGLRGLLLEQGVCGRFGNYHPDQAHLQQDTWE